MINGDINQISSGVKPFAPDILSVHMPKSDLLLFVAQIKLRPHAYVEYRLAAICAYV